MAGATVLYTDFCEKEQKQYLTYKDCVSNGEGCSKKYRKPYFIIVMTINKHCSITVKLVVIQKKSI